MEKMPTLEKTLLVSVTKRRNNDSISSSRLNVFMSFFVFTPLCPKLSRKEISKGYTNFRKRIVNKIPKRESQD